MTANVVQTIPSLVMMAIVHGGLGIKLAVYGVWRPHNIGSVIAMLSIGTMVHLIAPCLR